MNTQTVDTHTVMTPYDETDPAASGTPPAVPTGIRGNLRPILIGAAIALGAGLATWAFWSAPEEAELAPPQTERASTLLSGALPGGPAGMAAAPTQGKAPQVPGLEVMAQRLATRLEKDAGDGEGWALLARTYLELGNLAQAEAAQTQALRLRPGDTRMKADYDAAKAVLMKSAATP